MFAGRYPEDDPSRLTSQHELARAYEADGQVKVAVKLLEQVVAIREKVLTEDHPDRLASQHELMDAFHQAHVEGLFIVLLEISCEKSLQVQG